jgi:hypothetical protein
MDLRIIINRCHFEPATNIGAFNYYQMIVKAKALGWPYVDLDGVKAVKANFDAAVKASIAPALICGTGHGGKKDQGWVYTGQGYSVWIDTNNSADKAMLSGHYGAFLSCQFGKAIATLLAHGMKSVMGSVEDFVFCAGSLGNIADGIAATFFDASITWDRTICDEKKKDTIDAQAGKIAYDASQARFLYHYSRATYPEHKQLLMYDRIIQDYGPKPDQVQVQGKAVAKLLIRVGGVAIYNEIKEEDQEIVVDVHPVLVPA